MIELEPKPKKRRGPTPKATHEPSHPPNRLRELREWKNLSQEDLGRLIGVPGETIAKYERRERGLDINRMMELAPHLDADPWDFIVGAPSSKEVKLLLRLWDGDPEVREKLRRVIAAEGHRIGADPEDLPPSG